MAGLHELRSPNETANDQMALGVIQALEQHGRHVPLDRVSIAAGERGAADHDRCEGPF